MKKIFLTIALGAAAMMGCDSTDTGNDGGMGGSGGTIGPLTWVASNIMVVGTDECRFFDESEALTFEMNIEGSTLTMTDTVTSLSLSTETYMETDDEVTVSGLTDNADVPPCIAELDDAMQLGLDDPNVSIDQNSTLSVTWTHAEADVSTAYDDACTLDENGDPIDPILWFNDLPCSGQVTMTLTQSPAP